MWEVDMHCLCLHSFKLSVVGAVLIAAAPAQAESWPPGQNSSCDLVCRANNSTAISSGDFITNGAPSGKRYMICRANVQGQGTRPGYNLEPHWANACFVPFGGQETAVAEYQCMCR
jgi:hypothetical protein